MSIFKERKWLWSHFRLIILQNKNKTIWPSYSVNLIKSRIFGFFEHSVLPIISSVFGSVFPNMFLVLSITTVNGVTFSLDPDLVPTNAVSRPALLYIAT